MSASNLKPLAGESRKNRSGAFPAKKGNFLIQATVTANGTILVIQPQDLNPWGDACVRQRPHLHEKE
jgi:hypothetical protein